MRCQGGRFFSEMIPLLTADRAMMKGELADQNDVSEDDTKRPERTVVPGLVVVGVTAGTEW